MDYLFLWGIAEGSDKSGEQKFFPRAFKKKAWTPSHGIRILHEPFLGKTTLDLLVPFPPSVLYFFTCGLSALKALLLLPP